MKTTLRLLCLILALALSISSAPVFATDLDTDPPDPIIEEYIHLNTTYAILTISSQGLASCGGGGSSDYFTDTVYVTLRLYRQNASGSWAVVKTWNASGSPSATTAKSYYVTHGHNYKVVATVTVYNSSGTYIETASKTSGIVYY